MKNINVTNILGSSCGIYYTDLNGQHWYIAHMDSHSGTIVDPLSPLMAERGFGWKFEWHPSFTGKRPYTQEEIVKYWSDERKRLWDIEMGFMDAKWTQWVNMEAHPIAADKLNEQLNPHGLEVEFKDTESDSKWFRIVKKKS